MKSIKFKLVMLFLTLVLFVMIGSGIFMRISIQRTEATRSYDNLSMFSNLIRQELTLLAATGDLREVFNENNAVLTSRIGVQVAILDSAGISIVDGEPNASAVVISAMSGRASFNAWERSVDMQNQGRVGVWMSYATPVHIEGSDEGLIIYLRQDVQDVQDNLESTTNTIILSIGLSLVLATLLGILFARTLTEPITNLTKISKEMATGKLNQRIPINSNDEIGQLAESFNHMGLSLQNKINDMDKNKKRVDIIVQSMREGIIAFNRDGTLIHENEEARDILGTQTIDYNVVADALGTEQGLFDEVNDKQISINDKAISLFITTYNNEDAEVGGSVIVLRDITKRALLENMRKEFVANVSHEIRTPLTVIKTYAETLIDMGVGDEMTESFLGIINSEVDRMTLLTSDLLELSQFDNKQLKMIKTDNDLLSILKSSIEQTTILSDKKNQTIRFHHTDTPMPFYCDNGRINQVFTNLISNAVKYSEPDKTIEITVALKDGWYVVKVKDQGMGISKADIERVFERFYRVDKARSRDMGGTGLGLAIVKEIVEAHAGEISMTSTLDVGTTVKLSFPKDVAI